MVTRIFIALVTLLFAGALSDAQPSAAAEGSSGAIECPNPPDSVVRFALASGGKEADLYEWVGRTFRKVGTIAAGKPLVSRFVPGSFYEWNFWGSDVSHISRDSLGSGKRLSTPYALSRDGAWLAAAVVTTHEKYSAPSRLAFVQVGSPAVAKEIELTSSLDAVAWSPTSDAVVLLRREERYVKKTLRQRFAAAIGHPIPYAKIALSIVGRDGALRCSIIPAENLPYGSGYVRWDAN